MWNLWTSSRKCREYWKSDNGVRFSVALADVAMKMAVSAADAVGAWMHDGDTF